MQSKIEQQVMAGVAVIYAARALTSRVAFEIYILVASLYTLGVLVWVARIEQNFAQVMHGGVLAVGNFVLFAFAHTTPMVQLLTVAATLALVSLLVDLVRSVSAPRQLTA